MAYSLVSYTYDEVKEKDFVENSVKTSISLVGYDEINEYNSTDEDNSSDEVEKNGNDSFIGEEGTPFSPDPPDTDFEKSTPILSRQNTEISLSNITPNGSKSQLLDSSNGITDLKRRRTSSSVTASPGHFVTPVISPVRLTEKRRASLDDGDEVPTVPLKRQKTIDYSEWKRDYEGPVEEPHPELVHKVSGFTEYKRTGANINREYRRKKEFKNPDILEKLVKYYNIIEIGSNYPTSKFDPFKWKASSFYDALAEEQQRMYEKLETDKKVNKSKSSKSGNKTTTTKHKSSSHTSSKDNKDHKEKEKERDRDRRRTKKEKESKQQSKTKWDIGAEKDDTRRFNS